MAPQPISDSQTSTGADRGSIILICVICAAIMSAIGGGAVVRKLRERRLREEHIRREREKAEREKAQERETSRFVIVGRGESTGSLRSVSEKDSGGDSDGDDVPLGLLRKGSDASSTLVHVPLDNRKKPRARKSKPQPAARSLNIGDGDGGSPKNNIPLVHSVASMVSWTGVGRTLLEPSPTRSTVAMTPHASPRSQRLSVVMTPSSPSEMLVRSTLPPPAITISIPTSESLGAQARAEWEMEMQLQGEIFEQYVAWGSHDGSSTGEDHHEVGSPDVEEVDVVEDLQLGLPSRMHY
ncbi:hypothetical protein AURDEDRAFT_168229 [Auricularia subglabra TFB-10046 SS5]|nr:hypothetical protein AURDEDRAFT_168229 [Auricularia subglabra TFB-10046 SS5]